MTPELQRKLFEDVLSGLRVFNTVDKLDIPEELLQARACNIVAGLVGNYFIVAHPEHERAEATEWWTPLIEGRPVGHSWSCRCTQCHTYKQRSG